MTAEGRGAAPAGPATPVLHVAEEMAPLAGGVPAVVRQLTQGLQRHGHAVSVLHAHGDARDLEPVARVFHAPPAGWGAAWGWGPALAEQAAAAVADLGPRGVLHVHGVWSAPQWVALRAAARAGRPAIFTAHGMLEPWLWHRQGPAVRWKKQLYWTLLARRALASCRVLHAITPLEREHLRALLPGVPVEVIPNAVDVPARAAGSEAPAREPRLLFLGRIEPKKGVDLLIQALAEARLPTDWQLDVVGPPWSAAYQAQLQALVQSLGLQQRVHFRGPLFGAQKQALLDRAWVLVAPSHSEVVGLVNLEAAAVDLPSITTHGTGLWDWAEGGGLLVDAALPALVQALREAAGWSAQEQRERGQASRRLVQQRYSWPAVMPQWRALYERVSRGG